jgi:hypothetical protein
MALRCPADISRTRCTVPSVTRLRTDREPKISTDVDSVDIQLALDRVPDEDWSGVYNELARSEGLTARIIDSGGDHVLELRLSPLLGVEDVAPILSKAVELLSIADRERGKETSQMGQLKAATRAWFEDFKRNDPRAR